MDATGLVFTQPQPELMPAPYFYYSNHMVLDRHHGGGGVRDQHGRGCGWDGPDHDHQGSGIIQPPGGGGGGGGGGTGDDNFPNGDPSRSFTSGDGDRDHN